MSAPHASDHISRGEFDNLKEDYREFQTETNKKYDSINGKLDDIKVDVAVIKSGISNNKKAKERKLTKFTMVVGCIGGILAVIIAEFIMVVLS